jgi:hypothetical protein
MGRDHLGDLGVDGRFLLKCILRTTVLGRVCTGLIQQEPVTDTCGHDNNLSGYIKGGNFLTR